MITTLATWSLGRSRPPGVRPGPLVWVPALLVAAATLLPAVYLVMRAAGADEGFWAVLVNGRTLRILLNSMALAAAVTAGAIAVAVPLAWLTVRSDLPGAAAWSAVTTMPLAIPSYISGFVVATFFGGGGLLARVLAAVGLSTSPSLSGFLGAWITLTLITYPYVLLSVRAGLRGIDPALEDISRSLGESAWTGFRKITLPHLRPWIGAGGLLVALYTLSDFGAVSMMRFESFTTAIYAQYQGSFNRAYAAGLSLVLVALAVLILVIEERRGRGRYHRVGTGSARPHRRIPLGRWRWPATVFCAGIAALGIGVPIAVIGYWLAVGMRHGEPLAVALLPALNSVYVSGLSAAATVVAALPVAILSVRAGGPAVALLGRLAYTGYALPGIVVALSLVFFGARYAPWLYQTLGLLLFAYVVLFLPQAVGTLRSALLQVRPSHEEAARTLGRGARAVLMTVTVPLARPGVVAAAALVFLTTMKELPATLLLSPTGFDTLATRIWSAAAEGFFARAAAPALLLLALSACSMWLLLAQERRGA